jgi:hypothetical protein
MDTLSALWNSATGRYLIDCEKRALAQLKERLAWLAAICLVFLIGVFSGYALCVSGETHQKIESKSETAIVQPEAVHSDRSVLTIMSSGE